MLTGKQIVDEVKKGRILIEPFDEKNVGPNSFDVTLNPTIITYKKCEIVEKDDGRKHLVPLNDNNLVLDPAKENKTYSYTIPEEGLVIPTDILILGSTNEKAGSDYFIPMYEGRSSMARLGIQSHISAGFGDVGFKSNWTLEIITVHNVVLYPNMRIGQVYFHEIEMENEISALTKYNGKYINQEEAQHSLSYLDFQNN